MNEAAFCIVRLLFRGCRKGSALFSFSFQESNGLSQNSVISTVTGETGFMWFATQDGLNRFDGKEFLIFLGRIFSVSRNELWMIRTNGKLERLNLLNYNISPVTHLPAA